MKAKHMLFLLIATSLLLPACKSKKLLTTPSGKPTGKDVVSLVRAAEPQFQTALASKITATLKTEDKSYSSPAACRIFRDSTIQLSISPFMGIELFRIEFFKENALVFDKMNGVFYRMSYTEMSELLSVEIEFKDIQAAVCNGLFSLADTESITATEIRDVEPSGKELRFETAQIEQRTSVDSEYRIRKVNIVSKNGSFSLTIAYEDFRTIEGVNAPQKLSFELRNDRQLLNCDFSVSRLQFNQAIRVEATNTERYTEGKLSDLLNQIN